MKRIFVPVKAQRKMYKLFVDDLKKIYKAKKGTLPPLPKYEEEKTNEEGKDEIDTEYDFCVGEEMRE